MKKDLVRTISLLLSAIFMLLSVSACGADGESSSGDGGGLLNAGPGVTEKEDDEFIPEDEKTGMLGAAGDKTDTYDGYLGYGYNILESAFYNHNDIKTSRPIVNTDALAEKGKIYIERKSSKAVTSKTFVSSSAEEYSESLAASAEVKTKIGFTGSFQANFDMKRDTQMKSSQKLITTQALLEAQKDYIIDNDAELLAENATDAFKKDAAKMTAEALVAQYGTHVLANITLGGRFDLNYFYTKSETGTSTDIKVSAEASYRYVSGSASAEDKKTKKEVEESSKIIIKTYGGSLTVNPTSIEAAIASYTNWSAKVEEGSVSFVGASEAIPLWDVIAALDIADASAKSAAVKTYFNARIDEISGDFKDTINAPAYISELLIGYGRSTAEAKNMLRSKGVAEGHILGLDLNKGAGGYWIYLGYKTTADKSKAITGIVADYFGKANSADMKYNGHAYKIIPTDLNKGAKGKYIYLYYTMDAGAGAPLTEIKYQDNDAFQYGDNANGFESVLCTTDKEAMDLNKNAGGDYIYLWFKRGA